MLDVKNMNTIRLQNQFSWLQSDENDLKQLLWKNLRFREKNYFHSPAYRQKKWDGYKEFFKLESGRFLTGLWPEIRKSLEVVNRPYTIIDERNPFSFQTTKIDKHFLDQWTLPGNKKIVLHDYQVDYIQQASLAHRGLIVAPTGCHRIGQKILMHNKTLKRVEDVVVGDQLSGPDYKVRNVLRLCRGKGIMYRIIPSTGRPFVVNEDHILTLYNSFELVDISIKELLSIGKCKYQLARANTTSFIDFKIEKLGVERFYGFHLDGDQRYLLDDHTITHNSGKSYVMVGILKSLPEKCPTLVMTKSLDLTRQIYNDIASFDFPRLGRVYGGKKSICEPNVITVCNIDSVHKIEKLFPYIRAVIVDEVHVMMSDVPKNVCKKLNKAYVRLGLSATPFKFGGKDKCQMFETKGFFGPIIGSPEKKLTTKELQARGILSKSKCVFYPIYEPELPFETYQDAITLGVAESLHFNETVARLAKKLKGRTLILVERIKQGEMLNALIPGSKWICGKNNEKSRDEAKLALQQGEKAIVIVQQQLISAGINVFVHNMINAMSGQAIHHIIQRLGRGLRKSSDKEIVNYYDFIFWLKNDYLYEHSKVRIKTLKEEGHEVIEMEDIDF